MLAGLRRAIHAHLAAQQQAVAELRALREEIATLTAGLARVEALAADGTKRAEADTARLGMLNRRAAAGVPITLGSQVALAVAADGRHADPLSLPRHHAQVYSQNGEDGIIAEIFSRIGMRDRTFLEIGIEGGIQNNTRLLLEQGWSGMWIEGSADFARIAAERFAGPIAEGRLKIIYGFATPDGIDSMLDEAGFPQAFDFLSLDIDQHTSHVWRALRRRARVSCIEYNASIPPSLPIEVPHVPTASWDGTNWFGAGLKAMELIGTGKGLDLVGCDLLGVNAFFVDSAETTGRFRAPFTAETHYQPPQFALVSHLGHRAAEEARRWVRADGAASGQAAERTR